MEKDLRPEAMREDINQLKVAMDRLMQLQPMQIAITQMQAQNHVNLSPPVTDNGNFKRPRDGDGIGL